MKKLLCLLLAVLMLFCLAACGEDPQETVPNQGVETGATIEKTVLVDEAGIKITALSLSEYSLVGPELKLEIENNTGSNQIVKAYNTVVNNYMVNGIMSVEVAAGEKITQSLIFSASEMQSCGITTVATMQIRFMANDTTTWAQTLKTGAIDLSTSAAEGFNYTYEHEGIQIHAENGVKILAKTPITQGDLKLYIYNGSDKTINVQTLRCLLNGVEVDPQFYKDLPVGKHVVTEVIFPEELLEEAGVTELTNIQISFKIMDVESGDLIAETGAVALNVQK